jgi:hypothetical protein
MRLGYSRARGTLVRESIYEALQGIQMGREKFVETTFFHLFIGNNIMSSSLPLSANIERMLHSERDLPAGKGILALDTGTPMFSISRNLYPTVRPKSAHSCISCSAEPPEETPLSSTNRCYHSIMRYRRALTNVMKTESRVQLGLGRSRMAGGRGCMKGPSFVIVSILDRPFAHKDYR